MTDAKAALLVASSEYQDEHFRRLRAPAHDVEALSRVLGDPGIGGFEVRKLINEQSWVIAEEIEGFFADRRKQDLLLMYFSCHGMKDAAGRLHFVTTNTRFGRLGSTGISASWVSEQIDRSLSRRIVLLLDCCYSGAFSRGLAPRAASGVAVMEQFGGRGRAIITASDAMEYAYEGDELALDVGQPSIFTRALVDGLETGKADRDGDGRVGADELYAHVFDKVREETPHQTPTMSTSGLQGELYLARNPNPPPPLVESAPLPFELRQAVESEIAWQRSGAVAGLKALMSKARPQLALTAAQALKDLTADDDPDVRRAAAAALGEPAGDVKPNGQESERGKAEEESSLAEAGSPLDLVSNAVCLHHANDRHVVSFRFGKLVHHIEYQLGWFSDVLTVNGQRRRYYYNNFRKPLPITLSDGDTDCLFHIQVDQPLNGGAIKSFRIELLGKDFYQYSAPSDD